MSGLRKLSNNDSFKETKKSIFGLNEKQMDRPDVSVSIDPEEFVKGLKEVDSYHFDPLPWQVM